VLISYFSECSFHCRSSGRASPSTREAIAGMLSISRAFMPDHSSSKEEMASPRLRRKKIQFSDDYGENIDKVHQDEDYSKSVESYLNSRESNSENLQLF